MGDGRRPWGVTLDTTTVRDSTPSAPRIKGWGHLPALDGLRGVAVLSVLLFHGGVSWAQGGFLGVDVFFVLSGFLITSLLVDEWGRTGQVGLGGFWVRRARRLLPGLLILVAGAAAYARWVASPEALAGIRHDVLATLGYFANWHFIANQSSYFARTGDPSPLAHTWSLAIEEQFYLVWPLAVLAVLRGRHALGKLAALAAAGLVASATAMAVVYPPGGDPSRVYYGTDTRSHVVMTGALLAVVLAARRRRMSDTGEGSRVGRLILAAAAVPAAGVVLGAMFLARGGASWVYQGGLVGVSAAVGVVIAAIAMVPASPVPWLLARSPLRFAGRISYGVYLYHWPLYLVLDHARTGLLGARLLLVRLAATTAAAVVSYYLIEQPIRRGALARWRAAAALPAGVAGVVAGTLVATALPAGGVVAALPLAARGRSSAALTTPSGVRIVRPPIPAGQPVKVMFVGDSVAETLGVGLTTPARQLGMDLINDGTLGCGIVRGGPYEYFGGQYSNLAECQTWPQRWQQLIDQQNPDVVFMVVGRWEVMDRVHDGAWTHVGEPAFDTYLEGELNTAIDVLTSRGAVVALSTAPYYLRGERPDGGRWPEDDPARVDAFNSLIRQVAARHPHDVSIVDLGGHTSVGGRYTPYVDGIEMRYDGVHFTPLADRWLAPWLLPQLLDLAPPTVGGRTTTSLAEPVAPTYSTTTTYYRHTYTTYYRSTTTTVRTSSSSTGASGSSTTTTTRGPGTTSTTSASTTTTTRPSTTTTRPPTTTTTRPKAGSTAPSG